MMEIPDTSPDPAFGKEILPDHADTDTPKTALDWDGADDPDCPLNWSRGKRYYHLCVASILSFAATYPASAYSPGIADVARDFHISKEVSILAISLYVLGLAAGPMLSSGISETYGRRLVYLVLTPIALLFQMGAGLSQNTASLLVCRFLAGAIGAAPLAVGAGTVSDISAPEYRALAIGIWVLSPFLGPALGPSTTSYAIQYLGWRWNTWLSLVVGGAAYAFSLFQQETYKKIILQRRAAKHNLPPPHDPVPSGTARLKFLLDVTLLRATRMLLTEPIVASFSTYVAFNFAVNFAFFAALPHIYAQTYNFSTGASGLVFLAIGIGTIAATIAFVLIDRHKYVRARTREPEQRLYPAMYGAPLIPLGLFWFAWTARPSVHWSVPTVALGFFATGSLLVFDSCLLFLADVYGPLNGASANAGNVLIRYVAGAVFPLFVIQMLEGMGVAWAISLFGFVAVVLAFVPWVLFRYGRRLRARTNFPLVK